jgi:shikimate kinase
MKNIILIGMPGCGKSTLGRRLAGALHRSFVDADSYLEEKEGKSIPELFAVSEDCFRDAEERTIEALAKRESLVIATGGVKRAVNIERLKKTGTIYFIDRRPEDIAGDVEVSTRPLLAEGSGKVYTLYHERITLYRKAADEIVVNEGSLESVLEKLTKLAIRGQGII